MKESVAVAKEADAKKGVSPTKSSDNSIHHFQKEPEKQLGSLRGVIANITRNGGMPSVENIATELSGVHATQRAPALLALQQTHGNRYVQRVVAGIQAKLVVGQPGDVYEQEADLVADAVMQMPEPQVQRQAEEGGEEMHQTKPMAEQITPLVRRQIEPEAKEEELLQTMKMENTTPELTHDLESQIQAIRGGGQPLPKSERAFFEPRFGYDFSRVRVHSDAQAAEAARAVNAQAFTLGQDVVFGAGEYSPCTTAGRRLLAHELTHVVQQRGREISKSRGASKGIKNLNIIAAEPDTYRLDKNRIQHDLLRISRLNKLALQRFQVPLRGWGRWQIAATDQSNMNVSIKMTINGESIRMHNFGRSRETHRITVPYNSRFTLTIGGQVLLHEDVSAARYVLFGTGLINRNATWGVNAQWEVAVNNGNVQLRLVGTPHSTLVNETMGLGGPPWTIRPFNASSQQQTSDFLPRVEIAFDLINTLQTGREVTATPFGIGGSGQETTTSQAARPVRLRVEIRHHTPPPPEPAPQGSSAISYGSEPENFYFHPGQFQFERGGAFVDWLRNTTLTIEGQNITLCDAIQQNLVRGNIDGYASGTGNYPDNMDLSRNRVNRALELMCSQTGLTDSDLRRRFPDNIRWHGDHEAPPGEELREWRRVSIFFRYVVSQTDE